MTDEKLIISHLYQDRESGRWVIQTNEEHQRGVAELASGFSGQFGLPKWGYALGMLHDKGKERNSFQQYIRKVNDLQLADFKHCEEHDHAFVGGILAIDFLGKNVLNLLSNQIISHHTGLHDYIDYVLTQYEKQKRSHLTIAVGCTGGHHRSVTIANWLHDLYKDRYQCFLSHRDIKV